MGAIVHRERRDAFVQGRDSLTDYLNYDKDTLEAVKNVKDGPTTNIELTISCANLPKFDFFSQTDPRVYCYLEKDGKYEEAGRTEVISNDPNPKFKTKIKVPYNFAKNQVVKFEIYDVDEFEENKADKKDYIGNVTCALHEIVCAPNQTITKDITSTKKRSKPGSLTVKGTEYDESSSKVFFHIGARSFVSKNELSLQVYVVEGQDLTSLGKCEYIQNNKKGFDWPVFSIPSNSLPEERTIMRFEVYERTKTKPRILIGAAEATVGSMLNYSGKVIKIIKEGFTLGELKVKECKRVTQYTFLNYVYGGAEISLMMAIDFTNSNKDPSNEKSLHYLSESHDNEYLQALKIVGGILQYYDSDKKIPLFGFGAKLPPHFNTVSHCFSLNNNFFDPEVDGLEEAVETYKKSLKNYQFHGPTMFSEILKMAIEYAQYESSRDSQKYVIMLIITDGDINDMQATKDQIVRAAELPLSVLIIGVGQDEFQQMKVLDGDVEPIISTDGVECKRDIVQFVPFSRYKDNYEALARETLAEIPKQFLDYMTDHDIVPLVNQDNNLLKNRDFFNMGPKKPEQQENDGEKIPSFLQYMREEFTKKLIKLEMDPDLIEEVLNEGIPAPDVGLFVELASLKKKGSESRTSVDIGQMDSDRLNEDDFDGFAKQQKMKTKHILIGKERNIEAEKAKSKEESYKITQQLLEERDRERAQRKFEALGTEYIKSKEEPPKKTVVSMKKRKIFSEYQDHNEHFQMLTRDITPVSIDSNICLKCRENVINTVCMPCGHASLCHSCLETDNIKSCAICKQRSEFFMGTKIY